MLVTLYKRAASSYEVALGQYHERVEAGTQPWTPFVNLFDVDTEEKLLVTANFAFLAVTMLLFLRMRARKNPVRLRGLMMGYNMANVLVSAYVARGLLLYKLQARADAMALGGEARYPFGSDYYGGFACNHMRTDELGQRVARLFILFYLQKYVELADTFFFILRRSFRQVTFLHLFHHSSITVVVGSVLPFDFNGDMYLPILLNSIVHVLVYGHYVATGLGLQPFWSPYLTALQLAQFAVIFTQSALAYREGPECGSPDFVKVLLLLYMGSMLVLFGVFFMQRYVLGIDGADMCGVIKSLEPSGAGVAASWHGNVKLNDQGAAVVRLPPRFHEAPSHVMYCYQLTPVGAPMPGLYVSQEITRKAKGHLFAIAGGRPLLSVSWMVTTVETVDRVPH